MYGFWRLVFSPRPSAGSGVVPNGLETNTSRSRKNVATDPRIGTVHGSTSETSRRLSSTAAEPIAVSTSAQSSNEPSWPPQNAVRA